jgi:hypothetical protein
MPRLSGTPWDAGIAAKNHIKRKRISVFDPTREKPSVKGFRLRTLCSLAAGSSKKQETTNERKWTRKSFAGKNPKSEVGEHARPGRYWLRLAASTLRAMLSRTLETVRCARVFREGAENNARGRRAPYSISENLHQRNEVCSECRQFKARIRHEFH